MDTQEISAARRLVGAAFTSCEASPGAGGDTSPAPRKFELSP